MRTLILCSANVCRSPAAVALWRAAAARLPVSFVVDSAGLQASPGSPASPTMAELLHGKGMTLAGHVSRSFVAMAARHDDLILVMEPKHQRRVLAVGPELAGRVHLLGRWGQGPIVDPTGGPPAGYVQCLEKLEAAVGSWIERLSSPRLKLAAHA